MFLGQFFKATPNFAILETLTDILRDQEFSLTNWPINMYHMYILIYYQLPDLIHDHVDLDVNLEPQDGLVRLQNHEIRIPL